MTTLHNIMRKERPAKGLEHFHTALKRVTRQSADYLESLEPKEVDKSDKSDKSRPRFKSSESCCSNLSMPKATWTGSIGQFSPSG